MRTKFKSGDIVYIKEGACAGEYASIRVGNSMSRNPTIICIRSNDLELVMRSDEIEHVSGGVIVEALTELKKICTTPPSKNTVTAKFPVGEEVRVNAGHYEGCKVKITKVKHPSHHNTAYDCKLSNGHKISVWEHMIHSIKKEKVIKKAFCEEIGFDTNIAKENLAKVSEDFLHQVCTTYRIPRSFLTGEGIEISDEDFIVSLQKKQLNLFERAMNRFFVKYAQLYDIELKPKVPLKIGNVVIITKGSYEGTTGIIVSQDVRNIPSDDYWYTCELLNGKSRTYHEDCLGLKMTLTSDEKEFIDRICDEYRFPLPYDKKPEPKVPEWKKTAATTIDDLRVVQNNLWMITRSEKSDRHIREIINELEMMV